jgi:hypothetical protein
MSDLKKYPFEVDDLEKGSRIARSVIEDAYGVRFGSDEFGMALLKARQYLEQSFAVRGIVVTVKSDHGDLVVLQDEDASSYNERRFNEGLRAARRSHFRNLAVDRSKLTDERRGDHDRTLVNQGRILSAVKEARRISAAPRKDSRVLGD